MSGRAALRCATFAFAATRRDELRYLGCSRDEPRCATLAVAEPPQHVAACRLTFLRLFRSRSFKGFGPTMVSGAPDTGIQMTSYELLKRSAPSDSVIWQLVSGAVSGLLAQTVTYPGDTVRRRMQNNGAGGAPKIYRHSLHCTSMILRHEGVAGFFKGSWTNTVRAVPGAAVQFAAYEFCKKALNC